jgi:hypothetical protein
VFHVISFFGLFTWFLNANTAVFNVGWGLWADPSLNEESDHVWCAVDVKHVNAYADAAVFREPWLDRAF